MKPAAIASSSDASLPGRTRRIVLATLGLAAAGGLFGAVASAVACAIWLSVMLGGLPGFALVVAAAVGGVCGAVLAPAIGWVLLRRVPLGIAVIGTTLGATLGGVLGGITAVHPVITAIAAFVLAAFGLRWRYGAQDMSHSRRSE